MTVEPAYGTTVAQYDPNQNAMLGLEDATIADVVIPRLRIVHKEGMVENNLTKEKWSSLTCIILGLVKQRIMWHEDVDDDDKPMCKSPNFEFGFPNNSDEQPKAKRFPWAESNFDPAHFPADKGINGLVTLPCESCRFTQWSADRKPPKCSEQHTYPLLYSHPEDPENFLPALFTVQRTGIKPSRAYLSNFVNAKRPMFTALTEITFTQHSRGSVEYSVPVFKQLGKTDQDSWQEYGNTFIGIREFVKAFPRPVEDEDALAAAEAGRSNVNTPAPSAPAAQPAAATPVPAPAPATPPAAPVQAAQPVAAPPPATAAADDDDDLPF